MPGEARTTHGPVSSKWSMLFKFEMCLKTNGLLTAILKFINFIHSDLIINESNFSKGLPDGESFHSWR